MELGCGPSCYSFWGGRAKRRCGAGLFHAIAAIRSDPAADGGADRTKLYSAATQAGPYTGTGYVGTSVNGYHPGDLEFQGQGASSTSVLKLRGDVVMVDALAPIVVEQGIFAAAPNGFSGDAVAETWHSLGTCGSTGCTLNEARYRLTPDGECEIDIALSTGGGGSTAGTYTFTVTLPLAYQFPGSFSRNLPVIMNADITTGTENPCVTVQGASAANPGQVRLTLPAISVAFFTCTARIPLS
jgi:hypothetical protein